MSVDPAFEAAVLDYTTRTYRRVDIYEADGTTLWRRNAQFRAAGSISVDSTRDERRMLDSIEFGNADGSMDHYPGGFWYDKIIKPFRGVRVGGLTYEVQLGEFMIDSIEEAHFPHTVMVTGRDYTKKLLESKFSKPTTFASGQAPEAIIHTIASNGGITKFILPTTGLTTGRDFTFEQNTQRWEAANKVAQSIGHELYLDAQGYLVQQKIQDPLTSAVTWTFKTGPGGSIASYRKKTIDTRIKNFIAVIGSATDGTPVYGEAKNTTSDSPTRIAKLGERYDEIKNSLITTTAQANDLAAAMLKISALESFELSLGTLVIPWLEAGFAVEFEDPDPNPGDPYRFLLTDFTMPLGLGPMNPNAKRVTVVG